MLIDYHIHTYLCKHADGAPEEYVETAIMRGISEIGFSDHCPLPVGFDSKYRMTVDQFPIYRMMVSDLKRRFPGIKIRYGLEVDWVDGRMDEVFGTLDNETFDYLIGSVHYTDDFPFDNPDFADKWNEKDFIRKVWNRYFELLLEMVQSGKFDIIGHFDLPKKFGYYPSSMDKIRKMVKNIFKAAAKNNMAVEINTAGLRKPVRELYPSLEILRMANEAGVKLVLGSDSHTPAEIAANFAEAVELAKSAGYDKICSFNQRKCTLVPLG
ncbi:MAG TPA: histidinol phosphate phosphatase [Lentisphaeria bacterium]|nr:MAG: hypothetical protein A2X45_03460 [Lentisphaerae bacterium GWF2_50_93]HCE46138.1 histidinol phosphate phosphatase [Lentisphaeria bacterium]